MSKYDIILFHPPAIYDFRSRPMFPGMLGRTVEGLQFSKVPIGMLSIAEYLDRHGYRVVLDNLGDRMINSPDFDVDRHIRESEAGIFGISLHFQQHSQGALEIARLCKKHHPNAVVVVGGLTATRFHDEIIEKYEFIDAVIRAEAEKPFLRMVRAYEKTGQLGVTPNLTCRDSHGKVHVTPLMPASVDLDEFEYTRFDLLDPKTSVYPADSVSRYSLEVCRGCVHNCSICGGSAYTYKKYLNMAKPSFRSPGKIAADMKKLNDQGITFIGLFQDPRMAGRAYWQELVAALKRERPVLDRLSLDILAPVDEDYIREIRGVAHNIILHFCPNTGSDKVRKRLGRGYTNDQVIHTIKICHEYRIPVTNFFSVGLADESEMDAKKTWDLWRQLDQMEHEAFSKGEFHAIEENVPIGGQILGPIVLDPGSQAFDSPGKYGYRLLYKNLEEYVRGLSEPSWHQWLNYETALMEKKQIVEMIYSSVEFTIEQREKYGFFSQPEAHYERCRIEADRVITKEMEKLSQVPESVKKANYIASLRRNLDELEKRRMVFL